MSVAQKNLFLKRIPDQLKIRVVLLALESDNSNRKLGPS